jgi:uncharacterized protein (DUF2164 family)
MANNEEPIKVDLKTTESSTSDDIIKVDLNKPVEEEVSEQVEQEVESNGETVEATEEEAQQDESPVLELIEDNDTTVEDLDEAVSQVDEVKEDEAKVDLAAETSGVVVPEDIQKLMDFMNDTGGDLQDYVRLNTDVSKLDTTDVLDEYYKQTKPHLSSEERSFLLEETFSFDEEVDSDRDIKKKKIALKEEAAKARKYLESQKDKYYNDIKASTNLTIDQKEAIDFYNKYKQDSEKTALNKEANNKDFIHKTDNLFNSEFKGFEFKVGESKFRYNVKNPNEVKATQSDLNNFINKFVDSDSKLQDAAGYHKSLYAAMNPDALAQHFYEQGKADAIKQTVARSKNINTEARQTHGETQVGGLKFKVLGDSTNDFKVKIRNKR